MTKYIRALNDEFDESNCIRFYNLIILMHELVLIARNMGLLALEEYFEKDQLPLMKMTQKDNDLIKYGIMLIVDGTDPPDVSDILLNMSLSNNNNDADLCICHIIRQSILRIQKGHHERLISHFIYSFISTENQSKFNLPECIKEYFDNYQD